METKDALITFPKPGSSSESKRVSFSRARTDIITPKKDDTRRTKSASKLSARRAIRSLSTGQNKPTMTDMGNSSRNQMLHKRYLISRDSKRSNGKVEPGTMYLSPAVEFRRLGSTRSYDSCLSMARRERAAKLRFKLKVWTHTLILFHKLHQKIIKENQSLEAFKKQMDYTDGNFVALENNSQKGLDVDRYKAVTKLRLSREAKRILQKDPSERTEEEIKHVQTDLMVTKTESIQTLPLDCQLRLARHVGIESLGAKRFIIKEGYAAEYCYLIIVGSVIRARYDDGENAAKSDEKPLKEGQMFGETEMKESTPRKASYISASYTEILRITSEDYNDIFLEGEKIRQDEVSLLKQIDIFKGWNIDSIIGKTDKIKRKYFPNNWIIKENEDEHDEKEKDGVPMDSRDFEWIYIVKSGSIHVMKQFKKVSPTINKRTGHYTSEIHSDGFLDFLTKGANYERASEYQSKPPSRPLTAGTSHTEQEPPLLNKLNRLLRPHTSGYQNRFISTPDSLRNKTVPSSAISSKLVSIPRRRRQSLMDRKEYMSTPTCTPETQDNLSPFEDRNDSTQKEAIDSRTGYTSASTIIDFEIQGCASSTRKKQVTIGHLECNTCISPDDNIVLCKIKKLTKGDVLGLEYIVFGEMDEKEQPGFVLQSNGCECIMIHKKVYWDLIKDNFDLKEKLRSDVSPYPDGEDLKENLLLRTNWELHKKLVVQDIMSEKARLRPHKHGKKFYPAWK